VYAQPDTWRDHNPPGGSSSSSESSATTLLSPLVDAPRRRTFALASRTTVVFRARGVGVFPIPHRGDDLPHRTSLIPIFAHMDYTKAPLRFKLKKSLRYVRLYGPRRTFVKARGQYHQKRRYEVLPEADRAQTQGPHVGIIGCGNYAYSVIAYYLTSEHGSVIRGCMDTDINRAASLSESYDVDYYTDDASDLINDPQIDLIYIASNHSTHAPYAVRALNEGKSVHIEKPHVVDSEQLSLLVSAMASSNGKVRLGFNRTVSPFGVRIRRLLQAEQGPVIMSWFVIGHELETEHWYLDQSEGGRVLGNLCHWTDFLYEMIASSGRYPITVNVTRATKIDSDFVVSYMFGDGSIGSISFTDYSNRGHAFEGVREQFNAYRGNTVISMSDFQYLRVDRGESRKVWRPLFRNQGHKESVLRSYLMSSVGGASESGASVDYIWETAELFLATKAALEQNQSVRLDPYRVDL
jgi:predicted dehydrogenase